MINSEIYISIYLDKQCITEHDGFGAVVLLWNVLWTAVVGLHNHNTITTVEAFRQEIQFLISNFRVLIFSVLLQALFGNGHFSYRKNVLLLSVACRGDG